MKQKPHRINEGTKDDDERAAREDGEEEKGRKGRDMRYAERVEVGGLFENPSPNSPTKAPLTPLIQK